MFRRCVAVLLACCLGVGTVVFGASKAGADGSRVLGGAERAAFVANATSLGMSPAAIDSALVKIERGEQLDSEKGEIPVSRQVRKRGYEITVTSRFSDGSLTVVTYPDLPAMTRDLQAGRFAAANGSVSGCIYKYTSVAITWTNCVIEGANIRMFMGFRVDATMVRGRTAYITSAYDPQATSVLGTFKHIRFGITSRYLAEYQVQHTHTGGISTAAVTLKATLGRGGGFTASIA